MGTFRIKSREEQDFGRHVNVESNLSLTIFSSQRQNKMFRNLS